MIYEINWQLDKKLPFNYIKNIEFFQKNNKIEFKPGLNLLVGDNGCGKSTMINIIKYYFLEKHENIPSFNIDEYDHLSLENNGEYPEGINVIAAYNVPTISMNNPIEVKASKRINLTTMMHHLNCGSQGENTMFEYNKCVQYSDDKGLIIMPSPKDIIGSIYYHDNTDGENKFMTVAEYRAKCVNETEVDGKVTFTNKSEYTPIGIVVIPASHMPDKKCRVMSLAEMDYDNPENGSLTGHKWIYWGQYQVDLTDKGMPLHDKFPVVDANGNITSFTNEHYGYIASDRTDDAWINSGDYIPNTKDNKTSWRCNASQRIPAALIGVDKFNPQYSMTELNGASYANPLADFDGKRNTEILCSLATAQPDWQTASTITNQFNAGYSPAACCCARYHTVGTNAGDWYMPACGELGYVPSRFQTIIGSLYVAGGLLLGNHSCWSSSPGFSSVYACYVNPYNGDVDSYYYRYGDYSVRAFLRV